MKIQPISNITFGYKSTIRKDFIDGRIPLKKDITGHKLTKENVTNDHTIPKSKGGKSNLYNYSLMAKDINIIRGAKPLKQFIDIESLVEYIRIMLDVKTDRTNGVEYVKGFLRNLSKELKKG